MVEVVRTNFAPMFSDFDNFHIIITMNCKLMYVLIHCIHYVRVELIVNWTTEVLCLCLFSQIILYYVV